MEKNAARVIGHVVLAVETMVRAKIAVTWERRA
jgi:hypothetical protein